MTTQPGDTQHGEDQDRRGGGGFREAVNELFGRGERHEDDERARERDTVSSDYDGDEVGRPAARQTGYGHETRGDTTTAEHVRQGGDPTAQDAVQHGSEYRGDPNLPGQAQYGGQAADDRVAQGGLDQHTWQDPQGAGSTHGDLTDGRGDIGGTYAETRDDVRSDRRADDDLTDPAVGRADRHADEHAGATTSTEVLGHGTDRAADERPVSADPVQADHGATPQVDEAGTAGRHDGGAVGSTAATNGAGANTGATAGGGPASTPSNLPNADDGERAALVTPDRAEFYGSRWAAVKGEFVDEPRRAVRNADALVGELLEELQELFRSQRSEIERGLDADETSTEDLRVALRRYRSFFDRLLSI